MTADCFLIHAKIGWIPQSGTIYLHDRWKDLTTRCHRQKTQKLPYFAKCEKSLLGGNFHFSYTFLVQVRGSQAFPEIGKGGMNTRINLEGGFWEFKEYLLRIWIFICIKYLWSSVPEKFPFWLFSSFGKKQFCIFGCCWKYIGTLHHCPPAQMSFHQIWAWSCAMHGAATLWPAFCKTGKNFSQFCPLEILNLFYQHHW